LKKLKIKINQGDHRRPEMMSLLPTVEFDARLGEACETQTKQHNDYRLSCFLNSVWINKVN
jgi:hypothetical protein